MLAIELKRKRKPAAGLTYNTAFPNAAGNRRWKINGLVSRSKVCRRRITSYLR